MKVTKYLPILAVCLMTTGCNSKKEAVLTSGIDLANLDTTAMPGTSFYQYACGGWIRKSSADRRVFTFSALSICFTRKAANS